MKKIFFTTSPQGIEQRYGALSGGGSSSPSLGLLMLAAVARKEGFECHVVDAAALDLPHEELIQRLETVQPTILCISSTTLGISAAHAFTEAAKARIPTLTVVVGGPHVTAVPHETFERYTAFDIGVLGEGEITLIEILHALETNKHLRHVPGIIFRSENQILNTGRRPFITNLDTLPFPAWDLLEGFPSRYFPAPFKARRLPAITLVSTRGCPNTCTFCDRSVFGNSCHAFSAEYVVNQIEYLHRRFGIREFSFEDDTFITFKSRLRELCERLIRLDLRISWTCLGRVNHVTPENLQLMRRAGCWQISFGIESGNQEILTLENKQITLGQIRKAVHLSRKAGLRTKGFFILGHPSETAESLRKTTDFALSLPLNDISVSFMTPFPGTDLHKHAHEYGTFDPDWDRMNLLNPVFLPHGLTREKLVQAQKELIRRFYLRPRILMDYAARLVFNPAMSLRLLKGLRSFVDYLWRYE